MNNRTTTELPSRVLTEAQKYADEQQWFKSYLDYLIAYTSIDESTNTELNTLARAREGKLNLKDYEHILNPFKFNEEQQATYKQPATLKTYPLIQPVAELQLAEYSRRPKVARVISLDEASESEYKKGLTKIISQTLQQQFINELNEQGIDTGKESMPPELLEEQKTKAIASITKQLTQDGQDAIDFLKYDLRLTDKLQDGFNDWITFGTVISYKEVEESGINYEIIDPRDVRFLKRKNVDLVEDLPEFLRRCSFSFNELIERFDFTEDELKELESLKGYSVGLDGAVHMSSGQDTGYTGDGETVYEAGSLYEGYHGVWTAARKVGIVTYQTPIGEISTKDVDETYKLNPLVGDIDIQWKWINYKYEGWRIEEKYYKKLRPLMVQREELNAFTTNKLPYNGKWVRTRTGGINSIVKLGLSFQFMYNYISYTFEKTMAKNKDKIMLFPIGLIPKKAGWDEDKFMYSANALSFAFYDESHPKAAAQLQGIKVLDMGLADYAAKTYDILQRVKQEYWDAIGMNRQRFGDTMASDGKAVTEQAIFRSSLITEEYYRQFDSFYESELNGLLDYSKIAWLSGKKSKFMTSNKRLVTLNIIGTDWLFKDWKCFIADSEMEARNLASLKGIALGFVQNGTEKAVVAEVLDADNMTDLKTILEEYDKVQSEYAARASENEQMKLKADEETAKREDETKRYVADAKAAADVQVANIQNDNEDAVEAYELGKEKLDLDKQKVSDSKELANKKLSQDDKHHKDKMNIDKMKVAASNKKSV